MPVIKAQIEGREYHFAPLTWDQLDQLAEDEANARQSVKRWFPFIADSAKRAENEGPNLGSLDMDRFNIAFPAAIEALKKASGMVKAEPGEVVPASA